MLKAQRENRNSAKGGLFKVQYSVHKKTHIILLQTELLSY